MIAAAVIALQVLGVPQEHVVDALRRPGEPIHQENLGSLGLPVEIEWVYGPHPDLNHCYYIKCKKGGGLHERIRGHGWVVGVLLKILASQRLRTVLHKATREQTFQNLYRGKLV